jgi:5-methylcytosine-specific restriction protein A
LKFSEGVVVYEGNLRADALALARASEERYKPDVEKNRARSQAKRAQDFDRLLQAAYRQSKPIRVITLIGEQRGSDRPGLDVSKVELRLLDPEAWRVDEYGDNGRFRLVRGDRVVWAPEATVELPKDPLFVDQFSLPNPVEGRDVAGVVYLRSTQVRRAVLSRASGVCEYCGEAGFSMETGAIYLETHHVMQLSEGGPDVEWNVVALCPNDHRRAHYGADKAGLRTKLVAQLVDKFPAAADVLGIPSVAVTV